MAQTDVTKNVKSILTAVNGLDIADAEHALFLAKENLKPFATINYANAADLAVSDSDDSTASTDASTDASADASTTATA